MKFDFAIIGGGVMGLSLGLKLLEHSSSLKVVILEKESNFGEHASGRNSGVLHSGIYYNPDSLKAKFCKIGNLEIKKICKSENLFLNECGKVIVSQDSKKIQSCLESQIERVKIILILKFLKINTCKNLRLKPRQMITLFGALQLRLFRQEKL